MREISRDEINEIRSELLNYYKKSFINDLNIGEMLYRAVNELSYRGSLCMPKTKKYLNKINDYIKDDIFNTKLNLYMRDLLRKSNYWVLMGGYYEYNLYFQANNKDKSRLIYSFSDPHEYWSDEIMNVKHYKKAKKVANLMFNAMLNSLNEKELFDDVDLVKKWKKNIIANIEYKIIDYIRG